MSRAREYSRLLPMDHVRVVRCLDAHSKALMTLKILELVIIRRLKLMTIM